MKLNATAKAAQECACNLLIHLETVLATSKKKTPPSSDADTTHSPLLNRVGHGLDFVFLKCWFLIDSHTMMRISINYKHDPVR